MGQRWEIFVCVAIALAKSALQQLEWCAADMKPTAGRRRSPSEDRAVCLHCTFPALRCHRLSMASLIVQTAIDALSGSTYLVPVKLKSPETLSFPLRSSV